MQLVSAEQERRSGVDQPAATLGESARKLAGVKGETGAKRTGGENIVHVNPKFSRITHNVAGQADDGTRGVVPTVASGRENDIAGSRGVLRCS